MNERGVSKRSPAGPPELRLHLLRKLKIVLVMNVIPIGTFVWVGVNLHRGTIRLAAPAEGLGPLVATGGLLLAAAVVMLFTCWVLLPVGRWLRDYPRWHARHQSAALWLLPSLIGWSLWAAIYLIGALCVLVALGVIVWGVWSVGAFAFGAR